jgi:hypothetical protein
MRRICPVGDTFVLAFAWNFSRAARERKTCAGASPEGAGAAQLEQRCRRALPGSLALLANQPPGEIVHACRQHVAEDAEINITRRPASAAFYLTPWEAAVDGLIYRRRWIDGTVASLHIVSFQL